MKSLKERFINENREVTKNLKKRKKIKQSISKKNVGAFRQMD